MHWLRAPLALLLFGLTACLAPPPESWDADEDGIPASEDCDDRDPDAFPGAAELCDGDDADNNCDGVSDADTDSDDDGAAICEDCDDERATRAPGLDEVCDSQDNNCDGEVDEGLTLDLDGDGYSTPSSCAGSRDDCNDSSEAVHPDADEICDRLDNDCNGAVDEGLSTDADGDGHYTSGSCAEPNDDCDDDEPAAYPGAIEVCDELDNDCDGDTDEGLSSRTWWPDGDGDGFGDEDAALDDLVERCAAELPGYAPTAGDCDDGDRAIHPDADELCNDEDSDCDGLLPEDDPDTDADADGFSACVDDCDDDDPARNPAGTETCNGADDDCDGEVDGDNDGDGVGVCDDCDDGDPGRFPGAAEVCDGVDQDCDGVIDGDSDGDGFGACEDCDDGNADIAPDVVETCNGIDDNCDGIADGDADRDEWGVCELDCNDSNPLVFPGAREVCNGFADDNCDGIPEPDELDGDGDGVSVCDGDCSDVDPDRYPGAHEACNGEDDDCDLLVDEASADTVGLQDQALHVAYGSVADATRLVLHTDLLSEPGTQVIEVLVGGSQYATALMADLDEDGVSEIITRRVDQSTVQMWRLGCNGRSWTQRSLLTVTDGVLMAAPALDTSSGRELVFLEGDQTLAVYSGRIDEVSGEILYAGATRTELPSGVGPEILIAPEAVHFDDDGLPDLVQCDVIGGGRPATSCRILFGTSDGGLTTSSSFFAGSMAASTALAGELNETPGPDLLLLPGEAGDPGQALLLDGTTLGTSDVFDLLPTIEETEGPVGRAWGDLRDYDDDGVLDLILVWDPFGDATRALELWRGDGAGSFDLWAELATVDASASDLGTDLISAP